ncbi:LapA family protein [Aquibacillus kalidii]|uniref:LapA family protein n=1 Tax=Aquibacillus kalidii TaxID=2762597 RepID=UPI0016477B7D|nr:lipopolysaccharide assembly protein LapA domain-containing protein [Aquibacillus kalidii]
MKGQSYIILALVFAVIVAIFAVINVDPVEVNYLFGTGNAPLILVILFSVLMGGVITAAVGVLRLFKLQRQVRNLQQENQKLQENVSVNIDAEEATEQDNIVTKKIGQSSNE